MSAYPVQSSDLFPNLYLKKNLPDSLSKSRNLSLDEESGMV